MRGRTTRPAAAWLALLTAATAATAGAKTAPARTGAPAQRPFDVRASAAAIGPTAGQAAAARALRSEHPDARLLWNPRFGTPSTILRFGSALTGPAARPDGAARDWLRRHAALFGWSAADADRLRVEKTLEQPGGGPRIVLLHQVFGGLHGGSYGGSVVVGLDRRNRILSVRANVVRDVALAAGRRIGAEDALAAAAGIDRAQAPPADGIVHGWTRFRPGSFGASHYARAAAFPMPDGAARPVWEVFFAERTDSVWRTAVDAVTGEILSRTQTVRHAAPEGRVFRNYPGAPRGGTHEMVSFRGDPQASPAGWLSPLAASLRAPTTSGNNADTATHWIAGLAPDGPGEIRPVSADGSFDFEFADAWRTSKCGRVAEDPEMVNALPTYAIDAMPAAVNLFYHLNVAHDYWYRLGFTPEAGAMQVSNFGRAGLGGDALIGLAQAGSTAQRNNAYMSPTPDGIPPYSGYFVDEPDSPGELPECIDIDFDAQSIYHEYAHGVTERWVGAEYGSLGGAQGGAMGESWGDFYAMHYLHERGLESRTSLFMYDVGGLDVSLRNWGMVNPLHYGNFGYDGGPEVHSDGEIWNALLWDLRAALGKATRGGTALAAQLVADAMPLSGPSPSMLDMRDAILAADLARTGGDHQRLIWTVFARRGMGASARTVGANDTSPVAAFDHREAAQNGRLVLDLASSSGAALGGVEVLFGEIESGTALLRTKRDGTASLSLVAGAHTLTVRSTGFGSRTLRVRVASGTVTRTPVALSPNYASAALGAKVAATGGDAAEARAAIDDELASAATVPLGEGGYIDVDLSGARPIVVEEVRIAGSGTASAEALKQWEIHTSTDGSTFVPLAKGRFGPARRWGSAMSDALYRSVRPKRPLRATHVRLVAVSARALAATQARIAEIQVFGQGNGWGVAPATPTSLSDTGTVAVSFPTLDPETAPPPTVALMGRSCSFPPPSQGTDSWVTEVPASLAGGSARVEISVQPVVPDSTALDVDVYFLDASCAVVGAIATSAANESGSIPAKTRYIVSALWAGPPSTIRLEATGSAVKVFSHDDRV